MAPREFLPWDPLFFERSPLFEPLLPLARRFAAEVEFPAIARWNEVLGDGLPVRFQDQTPPPRGRRRLQAPRQHYSTLIHQEKVVPSRAASWHDFFNALVWGSFVRAKCALYARQNAAVSTWAPGDARRLPNRRTRELDALALLDEGGVVVLAGPERAADLSWTRAEPPPDVRVLVFGHAIYESLLLRDAPATCRASTVVVPVDRLPGDRATILAVADRGLEALLENADNFQEPRREPGLLLNLRRT